jgi:hypothetical protein
MMALQMKINGLYLLPGHRVFRGMNTKKWVAGKICVRYLAETVNGSVEELSSTYPKCTVPKFEAYTDPLHTALVFPFKVIYDRTKRLRFEGRYLEWVRHNPEIASSCKFFCNTHFFRKTDAKQVVVLLNYSTLDSSTSEEFVTSEVMHQYDCALDQSVAPQYIQVDDFEHGPWIKKI